MISEKNIKIEFSIMQFFKVNSIAKKIHNLIILKPHYLLLNLNLKRYFYSKIFNIIIYFLIIYYLYNYIITISQNEIFKYIQIIINVIILKG